MARPGISAREFEVPAPPAPALWLLPVLWAGMVALVLALRHETLLRPTPGNPVPAWLVMMSAMALAFAGPFILLHVRRIRLADGVLSVNAAGLFPHKVAVAQLDLARARLVDLDAHPDFSPRVRLWGLGLPGFRAGHYLLRNRARAFCLLTRREKVLLLPRHDGRYLLLTPERPRDLLEQLAAAAGIPAPR